MRSFLLEKAEHLTAQLKTKIHGVSIDIPSFRMKEDDDFAYANVEYDDSAWAELRVGRQWGSRDTVCWFRACVTIPAELQGKPLDLILQPGPKLDNETAAESLLYIDGVESHGLDQWHSEVRLTAAQSAKSSILIALRTWTGMVCRCRFFEEARLAVVNEKAERLYYLMRAATGTLRELDGDSPEYLRLLGLTDEVYRMVDYIHEGEATFDESLEKAYQHLQEKLAELTVLPKSRTVAVCGHSHIDMAWLWQLHHTHDKASRTFSTVLSLMERYPNFLYSQSSPYLYDQIAKKYPKIFENIKKRIAEGRWEVTGGMWVEPDTNLSGGEALVRQLLLGKNYIRSEFGQDCTVLWLPDVFGYSWVLPQLLKKSGIKYMWTNKMSWNQYNPFPYDTFKWRGMDGSEVLVQLGSCPEKNVSWGATYNGVIAPWEINGTWKQYTPKDLNEEILMPFGWGDGGGGPTKEMLEAYPAVKQMPVLPDVEMKTVTQFFEDMDRRLADRKVPVWDGEMYFEYHRGTYTTQGFIKAANRRAEMLLHDTEWLHAMCDVMLKTDSYPARELNEIWKKLCLNQFHDIIPGSGIHAIYDDARADHRWIAEQTNALRCQGLERIADAIQASRTSAVIFNPLSWARGGVTTLQLLEGQTLEWQGKPLPAQQSGEGTRVSLPQIPAMGWLTLPIRPAEEGTPTARILENGIETKRYRILWNADGQLCRIDDLRSDRQVLRAGENGNVLQVFEDNPHEFCAWNTEAYAFDKRQTVTHLAKVEVVENGAVQASVRFEWSFHHSKIQQTMTVYRDNDGIRFDTVCDWHEPNTLLKTCFPLELRSTKATYDIQFGNVERATHENTTWEIAQFEVCAHKWMDLSEGDYGVAMLNDCKYGCDIKEGNMRLTLVKAATDPDETSDIGEHRFTYCLLPHQGTWREAKVAHAAYELNDAVMAVNVSATQDGVLPESYSFASLDAPGVMIETVKRAENGEGWILRLYEYHQCHRKARLKLGFQPSVAWECDLMEQNEQPLDITEEGIPLTFTPYEIKTIHVQ